MLSTQDIESIIDSGHEKEYHMKIKRITALVLAALLLIGLFAGCSKDGSKDTNKPDSSGSLIDQTQRADTSA